MPDLSRGIRNFNPFNLKKDNTKWQGLAAVQSDPVFFVFESAEMGIRAGVRVLIAYFDQHNLDTINGIINRFAPLAENNTSAYIQAVVAETGFAESQHLDMHHYDVLLPLTKAIIHHENGKQPYDLAILDKALALAGVTQGKPELAKSKVISGSKVSATGTAGTALSSLAEPIAKAQDAIQPLVDMLDIAKYVFLALVVLGVGITIYAEVQNDKRRLI